MDPLGERRFAFTSDSATLGGRCGGLKPTRAELEGRRIMKLREGVLESEICAVSLEGRLQSNIWKVLAAGMPCKAAGTSFHQGLPSPLHGLDMLRGAARVSISAQSVLVQRLG